MIWLPKLILLAIAIPYLVLMVIVFGLIICLAIGIPIMVIKQAIHNYGAEVYTDDDIYIPAPIKLTPRTFVSTTKRTTQMSMPPAFKRKHV